MAQTQTKTRTTTGTTHATLPKSWTDALGMLKGKNIDALSYQKKTRVEWEKRIQRLMTMWQLLPQCYVEPTELSCLTQELLQQR